MNLSAIYFLLGLIVFLSIAMHNAFPEHKTTFLDILKTAGSALIWPVFIIWANRDKIFK